MGIVTSGVPRDIVMKLAELCDAQAFVETGTFQGATTRWAASIFPTVHTIELAQQLYEQYHEELDQIPGVQTHQGNSTNVLPSIASQLGDQTALHWLDGHWSGYETAGEEDECPLMAELECLRNRPQDLILIDDARLFLCAPPRPHKPEHWPTLTEIVGLFQGEHQRFIQVINDVIFIVPCHEALQAALIDYAQTEAESKLPPPKGKGLKRLAGKLLGN